MESNLTPSERRKRAKEQLVYAEPAQRLSAQLAVLVERAGMDPSAAKLLNEQIAAHERTLVQLMQGRIEPRKKYPRKDSDKVVRQRERMVLYIDESGKPSPKSPPDIFVLTGLAIEAELAADYAARAAEVKRKFFSDTGVIFHEPKMRLREDIFNLGNDEQQRLAFDASLAQLLTETPFTVFSIVIHKAAFQKEFVDLKCDEFLPEEVYSLAIHMLLERFVDFLAHREDCRLGKVIFESVGDKEDATHQRDYAELQLRGTRYVPDSAFRLWLESGCVFQVKESNSPLELADLVSRDVFEWARGQQEPKFWEIIEPRFYARSDGRQGKFGLKEFPDLTPEKTEEFRAKLLQAKGS